MYLYWLILYYIYYIYTYIYQYLNTTIITFRGLGLFAKDNI